MIILGIETSCDETGAAVLEKRGDRIQILSNVVASSAQLQAKYGGVIPEQAAREQIKAIIPVVEEALTHANLIRHPEFISGSYKKIPKQVRNDIPAIDAIAVTYGPGLIGSLLVGVETAKTLALVWNKPLIAVNHLLGHFYANWIGENIPAFPCLGLLVSGGHTDLVLFTDHNKYKYLGGTRDDAAGECFDKCARLLGLPYPGGPQISKLATKGDASRFKLPVPMKGDKSLDFSYSGLKTAVATLIRDRHVTIAPRDDVIASVAKQSQQIADLAAAIEEAIVESLVEKVLQALKIYPVNNVMIAGGVASNKKLATELKLKIGNWKLKINLHIPSANLCTDNAAMIAAAGFYQKPITSPLELQAGPNLALNL